MMRLVGISGGGWGSPGLRLLLAFAKATHRLSDRSVLRRFTMKKLIIILLMMAGSAHAHIITNASNDPICAEYLSMGVQEMTKGEAARNAAVMWVNERSAKVRGDEWAIEVGKALAAANNLMFWKVVYLTTGCSVIGWNRTFSKGYQISETEVTFIEAFIHNANHRK